jgi:hypothetical protein
VQPIDIEALKETDAPMRARVQAIFHGTCALHQVVNDSVIPVLKAMIGRNQQESAIVGTYYRMSAWLQTLVCLRNPIHIQAVSTAARSMFELLLDIKELIVDATAADRFHAFIFVERFRAAKNLIEFRDRTSGTDPTTLTAERAFISDPIKMKQRDDYCLNLWGLAPNKWPKHWSNRDTAARASAAGTKYEDWYRLSYPRLSWHIHAGAVGIGGISVEGIEAGFGWANALCQDLIYEATELAGDTCYLFTADASLRTKLDDAKLIPGKSMIEALLAIHEATDTGTAPD